MLAGSYSVRIAKGMYGVLKCFWGSMLDEENETKVGMRVEMRMEDGES